MTDFPLLPLPDAVVGVPPTGRRRPPGQPHCPGRQRQTERLDPVFRRLATVCDGDRDPLTLSADPSGFAPERVLVFKVAGSISDFAAATRHISGLEYLAELDVDFEPDRDFWIQDTRKGAEGQPRMDKRVGGCLYMAMPDLTALRQLVSLWQRYRRGDDPLRNFGRWFTLFGQLKELRPWGPQDRIPREVVEDFCEALADAPRETIPAEIELWAHARGPLRRAAHEKIAGIVAQAGGSVLHRASIPEIAYEAVLADLPRDEIARLVDDEATMLALCDDVMFVRPQSLPALDRRTGESSTGREAAGPLPSPDATPVAALLDGVPVQRHRLLNGRIVLDDPDGLEELSVVDGRVHGTGMASLILHGDLHLPEPPLPRPLHIHPVLYAPGPPISEQFPPRRLLIDTVYRAVHRMKDGENGAPPAAPDVFLVNLSLGDGRRPYAGQISPWARLLDYLAHRYAMLFLVSAGNIRDPLPVSDCTRSEFEDAPLSERQRVVLRGLGNERPRRTLLAPAEAINIVTVGALHDEASHTEQYSGSLQLDPFESNSLPNISSAMGLGHRRVVKPDILMPGGREGVIPNPREGQLLLQPGEAGSAFGVVAAAPDSTGRLDHVSRQGGTSAATALATRSAHRVFDALMDADNGAILSAAHPRYHAVVVRALLLHRSRWDSAVAAELAGLYGPHGIGTYVARSDNVARVLGYGVPDLDEAMTCSAERATLIGFGDIRNGQTATHHLPLPPCLAGVETPRAITVTLSWFSPVNVRSIVYRLAKLEIERRFADTLGTARAELQPRYATAPRGTLFHERYDGEAAVEFVDGDRLSIRIVCREQGGRLDEPVHYGMAVTIEAGEGVPIYQQIRDRLAIRART